MDGEKVLWIVIFFIPFIIAICFTCFEILKVLIEVINDSLSDTFAINKIKIYNNGKKRNIKVKLKNVDIDTRRHIVGYIYNKLNDISWKIECQPDKSLRDELRRIYEKYTPYIYEIKEGLEAWNKDYNQARKRDILYDSEKRQAELSERIILEINKISPVIDKLSSEIDACIQKTELEIEEMEQIEQELSPKKDYFSKIDQMKEMDISFLCDKYDDEEKAGRKKKKKKKQTEKR